MYDEILYDERTPNSALTGGQGLLSIKGFDLWVWSGDDPVLVGVELEISIYSDKSQKNTVQLDDAGMGIAFAFKIVEWADKEGLI